VSARKKKPKTSKIAVLTRVPPGLLDDLPIEDQRAISDIVGKPVLFNGYDEDGRAELEFTERSGVIHTIWVRPEFVKTSKKKPKVRS